MQKIPTIFVRDPETNLRYVKNEINPLAQWVFDGEGVATRKYDGTCVMLDDEGFWWARREVKPGKKTPPNFQRVNIDDNTGKIMGWIPIEESSYIKQFTEAVSKEDDLEPGTYELCGPKVGDNSEGFDSHVLVRHGIVQYTDESIPVDYQTIRKIMDQMHEQGVEGIVWHHPDGRMAKIKAKDFPAQ